MRRILNNRKMEGNNVGIKRKRRTISKSPIKITPSKQNKQSEGKTTQYLESKSSSSNLETTSAETREYYITPPKHQRGRCKKVPETKSLPQAATPKQDSSTAELKLKPKYRPIRPKPYISSVLLKNKLIEIQPTWNISSSNPLIVTTSIPSKDKTQEVTVQDSPKSKTNNYVKLVRDNAITVKKEIDSDQDSTGNSNVVTIGKDLQNVKSPNKYPVGGIELFFESMAQAVLNLPRHIQAEIKMEICKLVTMAEIKYCGSQSKRKTE